MHKKHTVTSLRGYYPPKFALYDSENPLEYGSRRWGLGDAGWAFDPVFDDNTPYEEEVTYDRHEVVCSRDWSSTSTSTSKSFYTTDICFTGMCRAFRSTDFPCSTPEDIRTIGLDTAIFVWQLHSQTYSRHIEMKWLDIHTIPQHALHFPIWSRWHRLSDMRSLTIRECKIRRIQFENVSQYKSIAILNCPLFEGFDNLPASCNIRIQVENCPLFYHSPVAFIPTDSSIASMDVNLPFVHRFPNGAAFTGHIFTSVRTFTLPNLGRMMDFWSRAREELAVEAFKPDRLDRRISEFGLESALEF